MLSPQWGDNSKGKQITVTMGYALFQSPQWGDNSKDIKNFCRKEKIEFQSPQWGDNSKDYAIYITMTSTRFSPRNGEIILKY